MIDAPFKTTGRGIYTDDMTLPGTLVGKILHSPHAHARIRSIDTSQAEKVPGVVAIVIGKEFPNSYGVLPIGHDENALCISKARYVGDNIAAVAAETEQAAREALKKIVVDYEVLPAWMDSEISMFAPDNWIHDQRPNNIEKEYHHEFGDVEAGFASADLVREQRFVCPPVNHAAMEPNSTLADFKDGKMTVWSSTQVPYYLHRTLSNVLELPMEQVRVIKPLVGGGFGAKSEPIPIEIIAACLSMRSARPVKVTYTREEVFLIHRGRPQQIIEMKMGLNRIGKITAISARIIQDGGAYCGFGPVTLLYSGQLIGALYDIRNVKFDGYRVLTNKPACGAMRGHGTVNTRFAFESLLDMLAAELGLDPVGVRRANLLQPPCMTVNQLRVLSYGLPECLDIVEKESGWKQKHGKLPYGKGVGMAASHYVSGAANPIVRSKMPHTTIKISAEKDGKVTIYSGTSEIGQGSDTVQKQIVADDLQMPFDDVAIIVADTERTPIDLGSYSSRVTFMAGNACLDATRNLRGQLFEAAAALWGVEPSQLEMVAGAVGVKGDSKRTMPFAAACACAVTHFGALVSFGTYTPPEDARGGKFKGAGVGPSPAYSYSAQVVEVDVDPETGEVKVGKIWAAHDCGKALNPLTVEGQIIGSVWMGLGQALTEEMIWRNDKLINANFLEYKSPSSLDSPEIIPYIVESNDPEGPMGAKEAGEGSLAAVIPAIANAVYDAVGVRITSTPITPEKVLAAIKEKHARERGKNGGGGAA